MTTLPKSLESVLKRHPTTATIDLLEELVTTTSLSKNSLKLKWKAQDDNEMADIESKLRLLRKIISLIRKRLDENGKLLVNILPYYPRWIFYFGKPWTGLEHNEAFLFFFALALTIHFTVLTLGFGFKYVTEEPFYILGYDQIVVEGCMFLLTILLLFYYRMKSYCFMYIWVLGKAFYWSSSVYSIVMHVTPLWRSIEGPIRLGLDIYVTIALLMHSLIDYSRLCFVHAVLSQMLREEMEIAIKLTE